jgi:hypothetical protein
VRRIDQPLLLPTHLLFRQDGERREVSSGLEISARIESQSRESFAIERDCERRDQRLLHSFDDPCVALVGAPPLRAIEEAAEDRIAM